MWPSFWHFQRRTPGRGALILLGFLLTTCSVVLLSATTLTTDLRARDVIQRHWRPVYDLVVLPTDAPSTTQNLPPTYQQTYAGGISIQDYKEITSMAGIEVAAPLAFVGYAQIPSPSINFVPPAGTPSTWPEAYYQIDMTVTTSDGAQQIVTQQNTFFTKYRHDCSINENAEITYDVLHTTCGTKGPVSIPSSNNVSPIESEYKPQAVHTGTYLIAAIDPEAENKLLGLDQTISQGRMLAQNDSLIHRPNQYTQKAWDLPLLLNSQTTGEITVTARATRITEGKDIYQELTNQHALHIDQLPAREVFFDGELDLPQYDPQRLCGLQYFWEKQAWHKQFFIDGYGQEQCFTTLGLQQGPASLLYRSVSHPDGGSQPAYQLETTTTESNYGEAQFRRAPLSEHYFEEYTGLGSYIHLTPTGYFDSTRLEAQYTNEENWLPEQTYGSAPTLLRYNAQGEAIQSTALQPTPNDSSYLLPPVQALTTLDAATHLLGDSPISAIRVRASGAITPDEQGWRKIASLAQQIQQRTGLQVQIVDASSRAPTLVYVPGAENTAPVGWVEQQWIAPGISLVYLDQLKQTRTLILGVVLAVCLGYVFVSFQSFIATQQRDLIIVTALGWRPWHTTRLVLGQALALAIAGGLGGMGLALLGILALQASVSSDVLIWTLPALIGTVLVCMTVPAWRIWHMRPAQLLRGGTITKAHSGRFGNWLSGRIPPLVSMALSGLWRTPGRTLIALVCLGCSTVLLQVQIQALLNLREQLGTTLLGTTIIWQTAIPQLAGLLVTLLLTFLSVADLLLLHVRERKREIGLFHAFGWQAGRIRRLFLFEGLFLILLGCIPGMGIAYWLLAHWKMAPHTPIQQWAVVGSVLLLGIVTIRATYPALRAMQRMQPSEVLRAE